jgi:hypothetical protein
MKWGAKRPRSKPIYKRFTKRYRPRADTVAQLSRALAYIRRERLFGRTPTRPKKFIRRTGYKVKTYTRMRTKRRLARPWR